MFRRILGTALLVLAFIPNVSSAAIVRNGYDGWTESSGATQTQSYTVTAGSDRYLVVWLTTNCVSADTLTGVTYNGVALTQLYKRQNTTAQCFEWQYWYGLANPATGANNLVASFSAANNTIWSAWDFTGMSATQPNATNGKNSGISSSFNISVTSTVDGAYILMNSDDNNGNVGAGADTTRVSVWPAGLGQQNFEYTGSTATAGKFVLNTSGNNGGAQDATVIALAPATGATVTTIVRSPGGGVAVGGVLNY